MKLDYQNTVSEAARADSAPRVVRPDGRAVRITAVSVAEAEAARQRIVPGLVKHMPSYEIARYFEIKPNIVGSGSKLILAQNDEDETVAILSGTRRRIGAKNYLSLDTILVGEQLQRTVLVPRMLATLFGVLFPPSEIFPDYVTVLTYNPVSYAMMGIFTRIEGVRIYPDIIFGTQSSDLAAAAADIATRHRPGCTFDLELGIIRGGAVGITPDFYPEPPRCRHQAINRYFAAHVGPDDRLLCVLEFATDAAKRRVRHALVRQEVQA